MDLAIDQRGAGALHVLATRFAGVGLRCVTDLSTGATTLASRRCGMIVTECGRFRAVHGRWWPHYGSLVECLWEQKMRRMPGDRCELFYHQSLTSPGFLTIDYVRTGRSTSLATCYAASLILDEIARLRRTNAIVCNVINDRISDRLLERWGWQAHCPSWSGRHFIKRFYGEYPTTPTGWQARLASRSQPGDL